MDIAGWIAENITEPLQEMIIDSVNALMISYLNDLINLVTSVMGCEARIAQSLLDNSYIVQAVKYSIALTLTLLAVRIAFEAFQHYIAYSTGSESHPGELLKKAATSAALIVSVPWITKQVLTFSFSILDDIQGFQAVPEVTSIGKAISAIALAPTLSGPVIIIFIGGIILWLIILIQMAVRAVNIAMLMVVGPWMVAFKNELGGTWFKSLLGQCFAIPIQIFMIRGAMGSLVSANTQGPLAGLLFIGWLWAALKFPAFLQQLVAQTGIGGAIGGTAQQVGTMVMVRRMMAK